MYGVEAEHWVDAVSVSHAHGCGGRLASPLGKPG